MVRVCVSGCAVVVTKDFFSFPNVDVSSQRLASIAPAMPSNILRWLFHTMSTTNYTGLGFSPLRNNVPFLQSTSTVASTQGCNNHRHHSSVLKVELLRNVRFWRQIFHSPYVHLNCCRQDRHIFAISAYLPILYCDLYNFFSWLAVDGRPGR